VHFTVVGMACRFTAEAFNERFECPPFLAGLLSRHHPGVRRASSNYVLTTEFSNIAV